MTRVLKVFDVVAREAALRVRVDGRTHLLELARTAVLIFLVDFMNASQRRVRRRARSAVASDKRGVHEAEGVRGLSGRRSAWHCVSGVFCGGGYMRLIRAEIVAIDRVERLGRRRRAEDVH